MENSLQTNSNIDLEATHKETLTRLEWPKITYFLSKLATFEHTKEILKLLSPWNSSDIPARYYKKATEEILKLFEKGCQLILENFNLDSFKNQLGRGAILSPIGLYHISTVLKLAFSLHSFAKNNHFNETSNPTLFEIFKALKPHQNLLQKLVKSVNAEGEILPNATPELSAAHARCSHTKRKITESLEHILKNSTIKNAVQDSTWMFKDGRYVLPVRTDRKNDVEGIARGVSQTGATIFIEPKILAAEQAALEKALLDIQIEEHKIIKNLSDDCLLHCDDIFSTVQALTTIDEIRARAQFVNLLSASPCNFTEQTAPSNFKFNFKNANHPLFILENKPCVSNTIELDNSNIFVLSGPNAGGKTIVLKTVGVFVLMAKCGLFVPCEKAQCIEYEDVFVLLGDDQNREEDLSTFSGHLEQIKKIMSLANSKTLILLDEGFVGTDPAVGVALARAVLEYFAQKNSTVIITTHFSSLKTLAANDTRFFNASMEFEAKFLRPTYKLLNGIPGQSYALELCERMGINLQIIAQARKYYGSEAERMENMLKELQEQKINIKEELQQQQELSLQIQDELAKIQHEKQYLLEIKETLVESYRTKLTKRLNAFANRLDIRDRQYQKNLLTSTPLESSVSLDTIQEPTKKIQKETPVEASRENKRKLSSFEELATLKLENYSRTLPNTANTSEKFRQPKQITHRALIDEAQESLNVLHKSFDKIDDDLDDDLSSLLKESPKVKVKTLNTQPQKPANFWKTGMRIKAEKFSEVGIVLKTADSKGQIECQFGPIKVKLFHTQLQTIVDVAKQKPTSSRGLTAGTNGIRSHKIANHKLKTHNATNLDIQQVLPHAGNTIDLRGKTVDEALSHLELTLDKMWRTEVSQVVVLHGHGLGKIKEAVRKYLERASYKLAFRPGRQGEGGDGVTIVEFDN
ncbi:MAG: Smr/MutS family protein [Bdellovibrionota bacterium]